MHAVGQTIAFQKYKMDSYSLSKDNTIIRDVSRAPIHIKRVKSYKRCCLYQTHMEKRTKHTNTHIQRMNV